MQTIFMFFAPFTVKLTSEMLVNTLMQLSNTIETLGLSLSAQKSCIILRGKGAGFHKWKQTHVKRTSLHNQYIEFGPGKTLYSYQKNNVYILALCFRMMTSRNRQLHLEFKLVGRTFDVFSPGSARNTRFPFPCGYNCSILASFQLFAMEYSSLD